MRMVPETGLEPVQDLIPRDFKSLASTYSATQARLFRQYQILRKYKYNLTFYIIFKGGCQYLIESCKKLFL